MIKQLLAQGIILREAPAARHGELVFQTVCIREQLPFLTSPQRAPSVVATMVAALGVLYSNASSPKLP